MNETYKILIVDDEPLAREELRLLLEQAGNIRLLGECAHAMEALPAIEDAPGSYVLEK